ncbi:MAG: hypothetical protein HQK64_11595, partial [Desulfamplus sp.]|nr:hypothetical protein [Desulfamplus sp.]
FVTATGNYLVIRGEHIKLMKDESIICNIGHFDNEIEMRFLENFSKRLKDLMETEQTYLKRDLYLLKHGRHLRLNSRVKIVVGKSEQDNNKIESLYKFDRDIAIYHAYLASPFLLIPDALTLNLNIETIKMAASICAGYTKAKPEENTEMVVVSKDQQDKITVCALEPKKFQDLMI